MTRIIQRLPSNQENEVIMIAFHLWPHLVPLAAVEALLVPRRLRISPARRH